MVRLYCEHADGAKMNAILPVDPRVGRMILAGADEGALREVLIIAAVLGLQDPRERPAAAQQRADEAHRKFRDEASDFAGYLKLWDFWQDARARSSRRQVQKLCRDHFLSYPRMREWEDIHDQLVRTARELELSPGAPASADQIHRALLPGLLSRIGMWSTEHRIYIGRTNRVMVVHEDCLSWGYGAEISARIASELFSSLDAPIGRVAALDTWVGYHPNLEAEILPQVDTIVAEANRILSY